MPDQKKKGGREGGKYKRRPANLEIFTARKMVSEKKKKKKERLKYRRKEKL